MATVALSETEVASVPDDVLYEVVNGQIVELPPRGTGQELTASTLMRRLEPFTRSNNLGRTVAETLIDLTGQVGNKRRPDLAFISEDRWPRSKPVRDKNGWKVVPSLMVEVISPRNEWDEVIEKIAEYFSAGVDRVWVVSPAGRLVYIYRSPKNVRILGGDDDLVDEEILPGFRLPLQEVFEAEDIAS